MAAGRKLRVLDLFSGIGGFSLGLEATGGFETVAFCEIDPYCRAVLKKHWPEVPCATDIRLLKGEHVRERCGDIDVVCGGFPCQDISQAGKGAGLAGERSGLWSEMRRLIEETAPRWIFVENVSALRSRGLDRVLGSLAEIGYDAEWHCIPASAVGAPHRRDRIWIIAYPQADTQRAEANGIRPHRAPLHQHGGAEFRDEQVGDVGSVCENVAHPARDLRAKQTASGAERKRARCGGEQGGAGARTDADSERQSIGPQCNGAAERAGGPCGHDADGLRDVVADADQHAGQQRWPDHASQEPRGRDADRGGVGQNGMAHSIGAGLEVRPRLASHLGSELAALERDWWLTEPDVGRVANGIPSRVDRLRSLGNAVVPAIPWIIGKAILAAEQERSASAVATPAR